MKWVRFPTSTPLLLAPYTRSNIGMNNGYRGISMSDKTDKQRTAAQNRAMHLMFTHLAQNLNEHGLDMRRTLKETVEIPWNAKTVKEYLWRPIQQAQLQKDSTTELTTKEIDDVFGTLNRHLGEKFGLSSEFPSIETIILNQQAAKRG